MLRRQALHSFRHSYTTNRTHVIYQVLVVAHPHLGGDSFELELQAGKDFGHAVSHALNSLHLVGGQPTTALAPAEGEKPRTILRAKKQQTPAVWIDRGVTDEAFKQAYKLLCLVRT